LFYHGLEVELKTRSELNDWWKSHVPAKDIEYQIHGMRETKNMKKRLLIFFSHVLRATPVWSARVVKATDDAALFWKITTSSSLIRRMSPIAFALSSVFLSHKDTEAQPST
jgi:secreted Zn-dependent insulinase-like peptidase